MRIKQRQVLPSVDKQRSAAVKVKASEALSANDIIMATGVSGAHMTVNQADVDNFTEIGGTLWIADYAVDSGTTVACAVPWKLITDIDTSSASAVGQPVYLSDTEGAYTLSPTAAKPHIKIGHVVAVHASTGAILLNPGAFSGQIGGQVAFGGGTTATVSVGAAFNGRPVVATMNGGSRYVTKAVITSGTLTITANDTNSDTATYMIIG
tara:strand:- start:3102 stop:3728 length:627 start_codon:yes stop_codon:yes gene_type:complete